MKKVFERLDYWRHFSTYKLENRVGIFFATYIRDILVKFLNDKPNISQVVIPEIPVFLNLIPSDDKDNIIQKPKMGYHIQIDFALSDDVQENFYFVELKTDIKSRKSEQDNYIKKLPKLNFKEFIIQSIKHWSIRDRYKKGIFSLKSLGELGYIKNYQELVEKILNNAPISVDNYIDHVIPNPKIHVLYIQPIKLYDAENIIDFEFIINNLNIDEEDYFGQLFKEYLIKWKSEPQVDFKHYL